MNRQHEIALKAWDAAVRSHRIHQSHLLDDERTPAFEMQTDCGIVALKALYAIHPEVAELDKGFFMPLLVADGE